MKIVNEWSEKYLIPGGYINLWRHPQRGWAVIFSCHKITNYSLVIEHTDGNLLEININKTIPPVDFSSEWPLRNVFNLTLFREKANRK